MFRRIFHVASLLPLCLAAALLLAGAHPAAASGPTLDFSLPNENEMPAPLGAVPFPSDLYFDQGEKGDGDGTLLNAGAEIGISAIATNANFSPAIERALDHLDGWGVSTGCHFFFDAPIDAASLPASPVVSPSPTDSVFMINTADGSLVPIRIAADVDTTIPNVLAVIPLGGNVLATNTTYACVVTTAVTGSGLPVVATADFIAARDKVSANTDANSIYGNAADAVVAHTGIVRSQIAGMAVFTTQDTDADLIAIQTTVLPSLPPPAADFSFAASDLVFETQAELDAVFGSTVPHSNISILATGYFDSPRFQTSDPDGNRANEDFPNAINFAAPCATPCEPDDERFVDVAPADGLPDVQLTAHIPFTVVIPNTPAPPSGYPIVIDQHGLGGERSIVALLGDALAERGFASIGIEAVAHGYRWHDPEGNSATANGADIANNLGGTTVPDGFADAGFGPLSLGSGSAQVGFFQVFANMIGVRDNFRQTCADLMQLVRLIQSNTIDSGLGVSIDENNIFYIGHSLGAIMGSCVAAYEPDIKAFALNAPGGGLISQLLMNSSIGAGALALLQDIFGLAPDTVIDDASIFANVSQMVLDAGDPISKGAHWIHDPIIGGPRNVMMIIDHQDEVVPNQAGEALAHAAGLELYRPYVANPILSPLAFPVTAASGSVSANGPGGVTAFVLQQGPAAHAATMFPASVQAVATSSLNFVPEHALTDEWGADGSTAYPTLERAVRIRNESALGATLDWFADIAGSGGPGTFTFSPAQNPNPRENERLAGGPETAVFFDRPVDGIPAADSTPDLTVSFASNSTPGRLTAARSILGTDPLTTAADLPPGIRLASSGVLPFFAVVQKAPAGTFSADLAVSYTTAELLAAAIADGSVEEAGLSMVRMGGPGTCALSAAACVTDADCPDGDVCVEVLPSSVDTANNTVTATGLTSFSTFALMNLSQFTPSLRIQGGGSVKTDCAAEWLLRNPSAYGVVDKKGRGLTKHVCNQGDPSCDMDSDPTQCTFRVGLCFNIDDPVLPLCTHPDAVETFDLKKPSEKDALNPKKPKADVNRAAILAAVENVIPLPQSSTESCATFDVIVPLKNGTKRGKGVLKFKASGNLQVSLFKQKRIKDADKLKLTCEP